MIVELLGTGSADRWPNPFCACTSCAWARRTGALRDRTSVLVDGCLLIDPGPDVGARGRDLSRVDTVLVTHAHPDHLDPAFLLAWTWSRNGSRSLTVAGPPEATDRCREWLAPGTAVALRALGAGDRLQTSRHAIRALPAAHSTTGGCDPDGTALLYEVESSVEGALDSSAWDADGGDREPSTRSGPRPRLLYATDTAAVPHEHLSGEYDLILLEETFGWHQGHGSAHLDLPGFAAEVERLRADGRVRPAGRIVAVHLSHHNDERLVEDLAALGAEVLPDGARLRLNPTGALAARTSGAATAAGTAQAAGAGGTAQAAGAARTPQAATVAATTASPSDVPGAPANTPANTRAGRALLITGGARSGKSRLAEHIAIARGGEGQSRVHYVATAPPYDDDPAWRARVQAHRERRPSHWRVTETHDLIAVLARTAPGELVLIDCLTLWLTRVLDDAQAWSDPDRANALAASAGRDLAAAVTRSHADVVLVVNEVGWGVVPSSASGRLFQDLLGSVSGEVARACDDVIAVIAGQPLVLKGALWT